MTNQIFLEDCISTLGKLKDRSISGIITSPPYNINKERSDCYYNNGYSHLDGLTEDDYIKTRLMEFVEFSRVINERGVICYNISYAKENPILPTLLISEIHKSTDLTVADIISWKKPHAIPFQTSATKLSRITELIYIIVKKEHLHDFQTNKQVSKVNSKTGQKFYKNYTNLIEAKNNDGYDCQLKASYSQDLVDQLISIYFPSGSLIYDPFIGIGTTALSCIRNGLEYLGSEITKEHYDIANRRIIELKSSHVVL